MGTLLLGRWRSPGPGAAELIAQLYGGGSALAYGLLCALGKADETAPPLPPLVAEAVAWGHPAELHGTGCTARRN